MKKVVVAFCCVAAASISVLFTWGCNSQGKKGTSSVTQKQEMAMRSFLCALKSFAEGDYASFEKQLAPDMSRISKAYPEGMRRDFGVNTMRFGKKLSEVFSKKTIIYLSYEPTSNVTDNQDGTYTISYRQYCSEIWTMDVSGKTNRVFPNPEDIVTCMYFSTLIKTEIDKWKKDILAFLYRNSEAIKDALNERGLTRDQIKQVDDDTLFQLLDAYRTYLREKTNIDNSQYLLESEAGIRDSIHLTNLIRFREDNEALYEKGELYIGSKREEELVRLLEKSDNERYSMEKRLKAEMGEGKVPVDCIIKLCETEQGDIECEIVDIDDKDIGPEMTLEADGENAFKIKNMGRRWD